MLRLQSRDFLSSWYLQESGSTGSPISQFLASSSFNPDRTVFTGYLTFPIDQQTEGRSFFARFHARPVEIERRAIDCSFATHRVSPLLAPYLAYTSCRQQHALTGHHPLNQLEPVYLERYLPISRGTTYQTVHASTSTLQIPSRLLLPIRGVHGEDWHVAALLSDRWLRRPAGEQSSQHRTNRGLGLRK